MGRYSGLRVNMLLSLLAQNIPRTSFLRPEPEVLTYATNVEVADGEQLEFSVKSAYNNFIRNTKRDGTWSAIRASCLLCGARTLDGCLVPLKGETPTPFNFLPADYNRRLGLLGDSALNKYLDSNRANNADPGINNHNAVAGTNLNIGVLMGAGVLASGANGISHTSINSRSNTEIAITPLLNTNFFLGFTRSEVPNINININGAINTASQTRQTAFVGNVLVFSRGSTTETGSQQIMFYSIGRNIDIGLLGTAFENLRTQIQEWIP